MTARADAGVAVLRDFPLRLWELQQQHSDEMLREFNLLLIGEQQHLVAHEAPRALVGFATTFLAHFGDQLEVVNGPRREAVAAGLDRMDSPVPLIDGLEVILDEVDRLLQAADEFCLQGGLLVLPRPVEVRRLFEWTRFELLLQQRGGPATPWPGPF